MSAVTADVETPSTASVDTRSLVKQAADELLISGEHPTVANVRSRIGRGSATTINSALAEWWQELAARLASARVKPEVPAPVFEAADRLWINALEHAEQSFRDHRDTADRAVADAVAKAEAALLSKEEAEQQLQMLKQHLRALEDLRTELERRIASETERRSAAETRIGEVQADGERRADELRARVHHLEELLAKEQARSDSMEKRLSTQIAETKAMLEQTEARYRQAANAWSSEKNDLLKQVRESREQEVRTKSEFAAVQAQMKELLRCMQLSALSGNNC